MYWIWKTMCGRDDEARITGRPDAIATLGERFDEGVRTFTSFAMGIRRAGSSTTKGRLAQPVFCSHDACARAKRLRE